MGFKDVLGLGLRVEGLGFRVWGLVWQAWPTLALRRGFVQTLLVTALGHCRRSRRFGRNTASFGGWV